MVELTHERIREIIEALLRGIATRSAFVKEARATFLMLGDDANGSVIKDKIAEHISDKRRIPSVTTEELIELAQRFNYEPITRAVAERVSPELRDVYFPELKEAATGMDTTTANTAPYAVPLGMMSPSKDRGPDYRKKKKKKKK